MSEIQMCEGCDREPATTFDSEGIPLCETCRDLPNPPEDKSVRDGNENQPALPVSQNPASPSSAVADDKKALEEKEAVSDSVKAVLQNVRCLWRYCGSEQIRLLFHCTSCDKMWPVPGGELNRKAILSSPGVSSRWRREVPDEGGLWWYWNEDQDCAPIPLNVTYSGHTGKHFVMGGQYGFREGVDFDQVPGVWMRLHEPSVQDGNAAGALPVTPNSPPPPPSLSHVQQMEWLQAIKEAAHEWSAGYPLQGEFSPADCRAARHVLGLCRDYDSSVGTAGNSPATSVASPETQILEDKGSAPATTVETQNALIDEALDNEIIRWQDALDKIVRDFAPDACIDGGGCDSGDPLDFTLAEIGQAFAYWDNRAFDALQEMGLSADGYPSALEALIQIFPNDSVDVDPDQLRATVIRQREQIKALLSSQDGNSPATSVESPDTKQGNSEDKGAR